jgi:S13-like H2TH domain
MTAKVFDLLVAVPTWGRIRANRLLNQARISPSKTVGGLSERQRRELLSLFRSRGESLHRATPSKDIPGTETVTETRGRARESAEFLLNEWSRLVGAQSPDRGTLERAARLVAAEETWRRGLGTLFTEDEASQLLGTEKSELELMKWNEELIVLPSTGGTDRYPAFQFQDGQISKPLAHAHWLLVKKGRVSPWTAASWARSGHPELEGLSPAQWTGNGGDEATLIEVAEHDASRLAQ